MIFDYLVAAFSKKGDVFDLCSSIHIEWVNVQGPHLPNLKAVEAEFGKIVILSFLLKKDQIQGRSST